jgi:hypothetical protein
MSAAAIPLSVAAIVKAQGKVVPRCEHGTVVALVGLSSHAKVTAQLFGKSAALKDGADGFAITTPPVVAIKRCALGREWMTAGNGWPPGEATQPPTRITAEDRDPQLG